jgi:hypothetical protein
MKVQEFYSDESKWVKGTAFTYGYDKHGTPLGDYGIHKAVKCCLSGAIMICYPGREEEIKRKVLKKIKNIPNWNDDPKRTFEDVKKLITELDI